MAALDYAQIADIYDTYVTSEEDLPFFLEEAGKAAGPVLELMCGTGRVAVPLAAAGIPMTCVDNSRPMLSILRTKLKARRLPAKVVHADATRLTLDGPFRLAIIPFNSFSEFRSTELQRSVLSGIRRCLAPDGRLIVTLHNPAVRRVRIDGQLHVLGQYPLADSDDTLTLQSVETLDPDTGLVSGHQYFEAYDRDGRLVWQRILTVAFRLVNHREFQDLVREAGFRVESLVGDYARSPFVEASSPFMIWALTRTDALQCA